VISDLFDSLCHAFKAYGCPAAMFLGEQWRAQHGPPLRVVIWQGNQSPPDVFSPQNVASIQPSQRLQYINPRPVATRVAGFSAELWATSPPQKDPRDQYRADLAYLDALVNQLGAALQQISSGIFTMQGGLAAAGNADASVSGLGYTAQCTCAIPIIEAPWPAQQLSRCSETWAYGSATAEVGVVLQTGYNPPEFAPSSPPVFRVPTPPEE